MEYVSGEDRKSMITMSGQLGVGTAISIAKQVCEGLAEAHRLGIIHRVLKPRSIQFDKGGQAKTLDVGIARSVVKKGVSKGITDGGMAIGTPQYMSPAQARLTLARECFSSGEPLEEHGAERKDIRAGVRLLTVDLLGRHVLKGAEDRALGRERLRSRSGRGGQRGRRSL